jgi:hypothetical protein
MIMPKDPPDEKIPQAQLDELNRKLASITQAYNTTPDPEMGGLSPEQVARLIYVGWGEKESPIQFNAALPLDEFEKAPFFRQSRTLLKALLDSGGVKATSSKNLPRNFVSDLFPRICDATLVESIHHYKKVLNEQDVWPLHKARVVAEVAGLIRLRKGIFTVPTSHTTLLSDARACGLFRCLFVAFFSRFNLDYFHRDVIEAQGLQTCAGYTLLRLGQVAEEWRTVEELPDLTLLPAVRYEINAAIQGFSYWTVSIVLTNRLLHPLIEWGLLEGREEQTSEYFSEVKAVRITPLFKAFLRFNFDP